ADIGAKVNECDKRLGAGAGTINLSGGGEITQQIVISPNHTLYISGEGEYRAKTSGPVILLDDDASLQCESWKPVLLESTFERDRRDRNTWSTVFIIATTKKGKTKEFPNGSPTRNIKIRGCHFRGARPDFNSISATVSVANADGGEISNNWLEGTRSIGIQAGGGSNQGAYARNVLISDNLLTRVSSQNIAVTNADGVKVLRNKMQAPGQPGSPSIAVIDVEPNFRDRATNVEIAFNTIDASENEHFRVTHGIVVQNGIKATPFGNINVHDNTIIGADHAERRNHIAVAGVLVRHATGVTIVNNTLHRVSRGIMLDRGSENNTFEGNKLYDCGSGSTDPIMVLNSSRNRFVRNVLGTQPGDAFRFPQRTYGRIREYGDSDYNTFEKNVGDVTLIGPNSKVIP
ncbi:MAG TPA: right-handed parallel beta-helix repeat-containing protein, partial [Pyrinomonadaceae bacterium]|nr:right-handed parallel beta-helix repeat-containing protein [Pyrinomonadaceae bacterium]